MPIKNTSSPTSSSLPAPSISDIHSSTLYLLFTPHCVPYAELSAYFINKQAFSSNSAQEFPLIKVGLAHDLTQKEPTLIIPPGNPFGSQGKKSTLKGRLTIGRYFSRIGGLPLSSSSPLLDPQNAPERASEIDTWLSQLGLWSGTLKDNELQKVLLDNLMKLKSPYLTGDTVSLADLFAWDALKTSSASSPIVIKDPVNAWITKIETSKPVKAALELLKKPLDSIHTLDTIRFEIAAQLQALIGKEKADLEFLYSIMEEPRDKAKGDLAVPIPRLRLKDIGKMNEFIQSLASRLDFKGSPHITQVSAEMPFIYFHLNKKLLYQKLVQQTSLLGPDFGTNSYGFGNFAVVEFSSPNIAKPFHAGHLRSTIIGHFTKNVLNANGWMTLSMNYLGDWGKQYGLLAVGYEKYGSEEELQKDAIRHLFDVYVKINVLFFIKFYLLN